MRRLFHILLGQSLLIAAISALLALPFVHRAGSAPVSPQISRFIAMGGNLADICGQGGGHRTGGGDCCTIVSAVVLTQYIPLVRPALALMPLDLDRSGAEVALLAVSYSTPPARAPPQA
jgi:hypothetical protein